MLLTEDQAKTKWCPHARVIVADNGPALPAVNRVVDGRNGIVSQSCCVASACGAWRWADGGVERRVHPSAVKTWTDNGYTEGETGRDGYVLVTPPTPTRGFCGLAGKPE